MATTESGIYYPNDYNSVADVPEDMKKMAESIEEKVVKGKIKSIEDKQEEQGTELETLKTDNAKNKQGISDIQKKDKQQDTDIENLKSENTELKAENERLRKDIDNNIPTTNGNGENITLEETTDSRFTKFGIGGNSKQETREGYNLLKEATYGTRVINGVTFTLNEDNTIIANGTATSNVYYNIQSNVLLKKGNYILQGCPQNGGNARYYLELYKSGRKEDDYGNKVYFNIEEDTLTFELCRIIIAKDTTVNNVKFQPMLYAGTEEKPYEQYGAMPSTEYISKIHNVGDNINLFNVEGTNFNNSGKNNFTEKMAIGDTSVGQSIYNDYTNNIRCRAYYKVLTNETVSISFNNNYTITYFLEANTSGVIEKTSYNKETNFEYTATKDTILCLIFSKKDSTEFSDSDIEILKNSIKIERGNRVTAYSKYNRGNANITVCNKNILPQFDETPNTQTRNGVEITKNDDGSYTLNGTSTNYVDLELFGDWTSKQVGMILKKGNIYFKSNSSKVDGYINFNDEIADKSLSVNVNGHINNQTIENITYIVIRICKSAGVTFNNEKIIFEVSYNEIESIEAHQEQSFTFPLQEGQKLRLTDKLADDGIHHKRKQVVLTGEETWFTSTLNDYQWFGYTLEGVKIYSEFICTHLKNYTTIGNYIGISNNRTANRIYLSISKEITTVDQLKTYLAEQYENGTPVVIEYDLAEEEIEPYTEEQQAVYDEIKKTVHSYKDVTHIFSTDETSAIFNVEAKRDISTMFNNLESMILNNASEEV